LFNADTGFLYYYITDALSFGKARGQLIGQLDTLSPLSDSYFPARRHFHFPYPARLII